MRLQSVLSNVSTEETKPDVEYGIPIISRYPCNLPSSPGVPCIMMKA